MHLKRLYAYMGSLFRATVLLGSAALAACGGGGGGTTLGGTSSAQSCTGCGAAVVTLTDAPGDFQSYIVNVVSLKLTRSDGTVVETVPATTQVDLAQLVNLAEVLSAKQIPAGTYVSASLTVDYAGAGIFVDNGSTAVSIAPSNIINGATGLPLAAPNPTQLTLELKLGTGNQLLVTEGTIANLALDFNLLASNAIAPSATNPVTVTVTPVLTATLTPDLSKLLRARGALASVDTTALTYTVNLRPFTDDSGDAGTVTVATTAQTTYAINGTNYTGSNGLTALAAVPTGTVTVAYGAWDVSAHQFTAASVAAGSSVLGSTHDGVDGTVIARTATSLTLRHGHMVLAEHAGYGYAPTVAVTLGTGTTVTEDGQAGPLTTAAISVGQHVQISGSLAYTGGQAPTLDASNGSVRLIQTSAVGAVTAIGAGIVTLKLQSLDGVDVSQLDFSGTGLTAMQDASAAAYTVSVPAALATSGLVVGTPARFVGFVVPFGAAPAPADFAATTLVDYAQTAALLQVRWISPGVTAPFSVLATTGLTMSQATLQASAVHTLRVEPVRLDPSTLGAGLRLVPDANATSQGYAIAHAGGGTLSTYQTFGDFEAALAAALDGTNSALQLLAQGPYDASAGILSVDRLIIVLAN